MTRRAIWATLASLLVGSLTASATRADFAAIIGHLEETSANRLDLSLARLGEMIDLYGAPHGYGGFAVEIGALGDGKGMVRRSRLLSNKIAYRKQ